MAALFYDSVHSVYSKDYTEQLLYAWATGNIAISAWNASFLEHHTVIAEDASVIVGFGDMDDNGYLDRLYVHKDYQNRGIASAIINELEKQAFLRGVFRFSTHASITAKPFFEKQGYKTLSENIVIRHNIRLTNFIMEKDCAK